MPGLFRHTRPGRLRPLTWAAVRWRMRILVTCRAEHHLLPHMLIRQEHRARIPATRTWRGNPHHPNTPVAGPIRLATLRTRKAWRLTPPCRPTPTATLHNTPITRATPFQRGVIRMRAPRSCRMQGRRCNTSRIPAWREQRLIGLLPHDTSVPTAAKGLPGRVA